MNWMHLPSGVDSRADSRANMCIDGVHESCTRSRCVPHKPVRLPVYISIMLCIDRATLLYESARLVVHKAELTMPLEVIGQKKMYPLLTTGETWCKSEKCDQGARKVFMILKSNWSATQHTPLVM